MYAARFKNRAQLLAVVQHGGQFDDKLRAQFTCFTRTKVQMLTQKARVGPAAGRARGACVLAAPDWPRGVVGIACSRLAEMFAVPVVLMESEGDFAHGSARSVEGYSVLGGLHSCAALLERFGGHAAAAGVAVRMDRLDAFREALSSHAAENRKNDEAPSIRPDVELLPSDLTIESFEALDGLGPFGRTFPAPTVFIRGAVVSADPRLFGEKSDHLSIFVRMDGSDAREVRCTWWRQAGQFNRVKRGSRLNMMAIPQIDRWNGSPRLAFYYFCLLVQFVPLLILMDILLHAS